MNEIGVAVAGAGFIGPVHVEALRRAGVSVVGILGVSKEEAEGAAAKLGIPKAYASFEEALSDPAVHSVHIATPNKLHYPMAAQALEAGKHVLCEKPLVVTLDEFDRVEAAAQANAVHVVEAFMYLHHPQTQRARQLVEEGRLGTLQLVNSWFNFYLPPERAENIRLSSELTGGSLWDVGVYPNSAAIYMAQPQQPERVWASQIIGESGVDVAMRAQVQFGGDVIGQISSGFRTPFREGLFLVGDAGTLHLPEPWKPGLSGKDSAMTLTGRDGKVESIVTPAVDPYLCEVQAMEAAILDGAAPVVPLSLSRVFLRTALAIYASARSGGVVAV